MSDHDFAVPLAYGGGVPVALGVTWTPVDDIGRRTAPRAFLPGRGRAGAHRRTRRADQRPTVSGQVAFRELRVNRLLA